MKDEIILSAVTYVDVSRSISYNKLKISIKHFFLFFFLRKGMVYFPHQGKTLLAFGLFKTNIDGSLFPHTGAHVCISLRLNIGKQSTASDILVCLSKVLEQ